MWFQIELTLRACSILKPRVWFQPKLCFTQFNNHYKWLQGNDQVTLPSILRTRARFPSLGRVLTFGQYLLSLKRQLWCVSPSSSGGIKNNLAMDCSPPLTHMKKDNQNTCMVLCLGSPFYICVMSPPHVTVWHKSPIAWLVRRLQRLQFAATSLFTGHHIRDIKIIFKIGWLLMRERRDFYLLKLVHKALPAFWDVAFLFRN